jgi:hypothetical protein
LYGGKLNISSTSRTPRTIHRTLCKNQAFKIFEKINIFTYLIYDRHLDLRGIDNAKHPSEKQEIENFNKK